MVDGHGQHLGGTSLPARGTAQYQIGGDGGVSTNASAAMVHVTVTGTRAAPATSPCGTEQHRRPSSRRSTSRPRTRRCRTRRSLRSSPGTSHCSTSPAVTWSSTSRAGSPRSRRRCDDRRPPSLRPREPKRDLLHGLAPRRGPVLPRPTPAPTPASTTSAPTASCTCSARPTTGCSCCSRRATWPPRRRCSTASTATSPTPGDQESLATVGHLFEAALYIGRAQPEVASATAGARRSRPRRRSSSAARSPASAPTSCCVYPEGNYIRASDDRPFLQIGESKYGKFMLEVAVHAQVGHGSGRQDRARAR